LVFGPLLDKNDLFFLPRQARDKHRESTLNTPHPFWFSNDRIAKQTALALTVLEKHEAWRGRGGVPANVRDLRGRGATDDTAGTPEVDHYIALWSQALNRAWQTIPGADFDIEQNSCEWPYAKGIERLLRRPGTKTSFLRRSLAPFYAETRTIYQDRLRTNIRKR
jgi:hypothetical protein